MNEDYNINDAFCILHWNGFHNNTDGRSYPCCVVNHLEPYGNVKNASINDIMNSDKWKQARLDMLNGKKVSACNYCYSIENTTGIQYSPRTDANRNFQHHIKHAIANTADDGSIDPKISYFDVRFSNICNMKCRTCNPSSSSKFAQEFRQIWPPFQEPAVVTVKEKSANIIEQILEHKASIETVYFAGGEPLITDEHYAILETLVEKGLSNKIFLRYSTNCSILNYKQKDIVDLWSRFKSVHLFASIDHYGERAEYIRHGVDWATVEKNIHVLNNVPNVLLGMSSVISVFNYCTYNEFYEYIMNKNIIRPDQIVTINAEGPPYISSQILPRHIKDRYKDRVLSIPNNSVTQSMIKYCEAADTWSVYKDEFLLHLKLRDDYRNEDFTKVFPELKEMVNG